MDLIKVSDTPGLQVVQDEFIALKPMCEALGIDPWSQTEKLNSKSWATTRKIPVVASDGKTREMTALHKDAVPMWLATLSEHKVKPEARPILIAYQREAARALNDYFNKKAAKHNQPTQMPAPMEHPEITHQKVLQQKLTTLNMASRFIDDLQIQARAWLILEQLNPQAPVEPASHAAQAHRGRNHQPTTLTVTEYLEGRGLHETEIIKIRPEFSSYLLAEHINIHGRKPQRRSGHYRYTTADKALMDTAYQRMEQAWEGNW